MRVARPHLLTVVGNRPQFVKMAPVSAEIRRRGYHEFVVHTGQHHDSAMSQVFFDELEISPPDLNLGLGGGSHGAMTAAMLEALERTMQEQQPGGVLIYGDTNSTLAAALAAVKLHIPIAHVEAGPRIYDMNTPEEVNRVIADHIAQLRFCPDEISVENMARENITQGVHRTGDVMYDAFLQFSKVAKQRSEILVKLNLSPGEPFALLTAHRPNNTDSLDALQRLAELLTRCPMPVVFPVHPRTEAALKTHGLWDDLGQIPHLHRIPPTSYLDTLQLLNHASVVMTDSGGLQKEGFFAGKPVLILFYTTPWPQILNCGWQKLCWTDNGIDVSMLLHEITNFRPHGERPTFFGDGHAAAQIVDVLEAQPWWGAPRPTAVITSNS